VTSVEASRYNSSYPGAIRSITRIVNEEMAEWHISGIAIALIDDQNVIWAEGFGNVRRDSIFRVGSISKLFNAIAVMQQVEAGRLDLDAPLPASILPTNPFSNQSPLTIRQLLCHRSGLPRESPIGSYFDESQPTLSETVASLKSCELVSSPGEKARYSNTAPSLAGYLVEQVTGTAFSTYQYRDILSPLEMNSSAWRLADIALHKLAPSRMRVADGSGGWLRKAAPIFDLGTIPAGNLYSTVDDLSRFVSALVRSSPTIVKPETLREMWTPQMTSEHVGYGLGFVVGRFRDRRTIGHNGAVYGFSSTLVVLPECKLGVVVLSNEDIVNGRMRRIAEAALGGLLEAKLGETSTPTAPVAFPLDMEAFCGDYDSESFWAHIGLENGDLIAEISGQPTRFVRRGNFEFMANSRLEHATQVIFHPDENGQVRGFKLGAHEFHRIHRDTPPAPADWHAYLGSYGPEFIPIVISERHGSLYAMTENMLDYKLTPIGRHTFALPPGLYTDEKVRFNPGSDGTAQSVNFANMLLPRRRAS
jgi:CubicO group peptidase (beta-lactamase class C family)